MYFAPKRQYLIRLTAFALGMLPIGAFADWKLNMHEGVTPISREVYSLHMLILWLCVIIGIGVFGVMFYSMLKHRKSAGHEAAQFHHSTLAEIAWTIIPFVILVAMAVPATKALVMMEDTGNAAVTIKVTGYQWKWRYDYVDDGVGFYSTLANSSRSKIYDDPTGVENYLLEVDNHLVIPAGKKVRLLITADDVIHAWWVPEFGMKKDAIPGYVNELWVKTDQIGTYRGQCAELCGVDHGFMPIVVDVKSEADYQAWIAEQKTKTASVSPVTDASAATRLATR